MIILLLSSHNDYIVAVDRKAVLGHNDFTPRRATDYAPRLSTHTQVILLSSSSIYIIYPHYVCVCVCKM